MLIFRAGGCKRTREWVTPGYYNYTLFDIIIIIFYLIYYYKHAQVGVFDLFEAVNMSNMPRQACFTCSRRQWAR